LRETRYDHALVLELSPHEFPQELELIKDTLIEVFEYLCQETKHSSRSEDMTGSN
jgi:hypothetical protein